LSIIILKKEEFFKRYMIIYRKYVQEKVNEGMINEITKTTLEAKLRFKKETGAAYMKDVRERMCNKETIPDYLMEVEGIVYNKGLGIYEDRDLNKRRTILIKKRPYKLGIDIHVESSIDIRLEDMLNLDGLNELIQENSLK
jgi:hypothetical protein